MTIECPVCFSEHDDRIETGDIDDRYNNSISSLFVGREEYKRRAKKTAFILHDIEGRTILTCPICNCTFDNSTKEVFNR